MILHIPHSSTKMLNDVNVPNLQDNLNLLTDWYTNELFYHESSESVIFPYSRFSIDVERLNENEPMDLYGQGILYENDVFGNYITRTDNELHKSIYDKYHYNLNVIVNSHLCYFPVVYIVDCHSFDESLLNDTFIAPDICLGFNNGNRNYYDLLSYFNNNNLSVGINDPYSGSIIPSWFNDNENVKSIMIEVNKNLYLNSDYNKNDKFLYYQKIIKGALNIIYEYEETEGQKYIRQT